MPVKRKIVWSFQAKEQWKEVLRFYTKRNGSAYYSRRLNERLLGVLARIRDWPEMGEVTDNENYRRHVVEYFAVFYWIKDDGIEIAEIRDARQDAER